MKPTFQLLRDPGLQQAASHAIKHCRGADAHLGASLVERPISQSIPWVPTFRFGSSSKGLRAYEVCRTLRPDSLLSSLSAIRAATYPIAVSVVVPEGVTHEDGAHREIERLSHEGVSILTIDNGNEVRSRTTCPPVAQHITVEDWRTQIASLPPRFRSTFANSYATYQTSVVQGVQHAGQVVEAIVNASVDHAIGAGLLSSGAASKPLARKIDALWEKYPDHRAMLGAARMFAARYRNPSSHAPTTAEVAVRRVMQARTAMLEAATTSHELLGFLGTQSVNHKKIHLP